MTYKGIVEHTQAVGGVTGLAQLTEAVKRSSLDVDAVYWNYCNRGLFTCITAWKDEDCNYRRMLSVEINRLQPVTDDAT